MREPATTLQIEISLEPAQIGQLPNRPCRIPYLRALADGRALVEIFEEAGLRVFLVKRLSDAKRCQRCMLQYLS